MFAVSTGPQAKLLTTYGVGNFFKGGANADKVVLAFETAAAAGAAVAAAFSYSALKAGVELDAGVTPAMPTCAPATRNWPCRCCSSTTSRPCACPSRPMRTDAAAGARRSDLAAYGGYLKVGAEVAAGYELSGSKSFSLGGLALSEKYDLSVIGRIGLKAGVAGRFSILVTADGTAGVDARAGPRHAQGALSIAADVNADFKNQIDFRRPPTSFSAPCSASTGRTS